MELKCDYQLRGGDMETFKKTSSICPRTPKIKEFLSKIHLSGEIMETPTKITYTSKSLNFLPLVELNYISKGSALLLYLTSDPVLCLLHF